MGDLLLANVMDYPSPKPRVSARIWIAQVRLGSEGATAALWDGYRGELLRLARRALGWPQPVLANDVDLALEVFEDFILGARSGRYGTVTCHTDLVRLFAGMTRRKAAAAARSSMRYARRVTRAARTAPGGPDPTLVVALQDEVEERVLALPEHRLRVVARAVMLGLTNREIALSLGCSIRTVERALHAIATTWHRSGSDGPRGGGGGLNCFDRHFPRRLVPGAPAGGGPRP